MGVCDRCGDQCEKSTGHSTGHLILLLVFVTGVVTGVKREGEERLINREHICTVLGQ